MDHYFDQNFLILYSPPRSEVLDEEDRLYFFLQYVDDKGVVRDDRDPLQLILPILKA